MGQSWGGGSQPEVWGPQAARAWRHRAGVEWAPGRTRSGGCWGGELGRATRRPGGRDLDGQWWGPG
jgi:hypothetical protein